MFTREGIRAFHAWTHEKLDLLFDHAEKLPSELFVREMPGFGRASVREQLSHILGCEQFWLCNLQNLKLERVPASSHKAVADLKRLKRQVIADTHRYLDALSEQELNAETFQPPGRTGPLRSPAFILHHVLTHAFHHKGQVVAMCRLLDFPAPDTDMQP